MEPVAVSVASAITVREAALGDACDVAALLDVLGYPCTREEAGDRILHVRQDPRQHLLIAEIDGMACGLAALDVRFSITRGADLARINALVVSPHCAGQGIGRRLLREVEGIARRAGAVRVEVTASAAREGAHAFYQCCGFSDGSQHLIKRLGD